jgi:hypothetical protein
MGPWESVVATRQRAKTLEAMGADPLDFRIEDLEAVARTFDINVRRPGEGHACFTTLGGGRLQACRPAVQSSRT